VVKQLTANPGIASANVVQAVPEQTAEELSAPISTAPMLNVLTTPGLNMPMTPAETIQVAETPPTSSIWRGRFDMLYLINELT